MKKNGITLIGFTFIIGIFAIMVVILYPKYMELRDKSDSSVFKSTSLQAYRETKEMYMLKQKNIFSNCSDNYDKLLKVDNDKYSYYIVLSSQGNITNFKMTDGNHKLEAKNSNAVKEDDIGEIYKIESVDVGKKFVMKSDGSIILENN